VKVAVVDVHQNSHTNELRIGCLDLLLEEENRSPNSKWCNGDELPTEGNGVTCIRLGDDLNIVLAIVERGAGDEGGAVQVAEGRQLINLMRREQSIGKAIKNQRKKLEWVARHWALTHCVSLI
jgi:hypothetical protein